MADYLEAYTLRFALPVRTSITVDCLSRRDGRFVITAGDLLFEADNVVVAMSSWQKPRIPLFARELDPDIVQLHSSEYQNASQLRDGGVLIVGAGNSGAEVAIESARDHPVWLSGRDTGHVPFRIDSAIARFIVIPILFRFIFHRVLTRNTPIGRRTPRKILSQGMSLVRTKPKDLSAARIQRVPRVVGVRDRRPLLEDGRVLDVANVIWCTGFHPGFSWIDLPVFGDQELLHERGVVKSVPGLYFVGLNFLFAASSSMIHGVGRDAQYVAQAIHSRV
jgi:putative flavoprotein involved in K+ transport